MRYVDAGSASAPDTAISGGADANAASANSLLGPNDVLCGRDKHSFNNVGNRTFRTAINANLPQYIACKMRTERSEVIHALHGELVGGTANLKFYKRVLTPSKDGKQQVATLIELDYKQS